MRWTMWIVVALASGCAMDGGPGVILDRAWWNEPGVLRVALWTARAGSFVLEDAAGTTEGDADCLEERCLVTFEGAREPRRLWHRLDSRAFVTPLLACGEDPFGLCPFGYTCVDNTCAPLCSPLHPQGACVADGASCDDGWCTIPDC